MTRILVDGPWRALDSRHMEGALTQSAAFARVRADGNGEGP